jgi:hypothetical protein
MVPSRHLHFPVLPVASKRTCVDRALPHAQLARRSLVGVLQRLQLLAPGESLERHGDVEAALRGAWTDNANACSVQYSGTLHFVG